MTSTTVSSRLDHDGAAGLAGDFAGFERQRVTAVGNRFLDRVHVVLNSSNENGRASKARPLAEFGMRARRRPATIRGDASLIRLREQMASIGVGPRTWRAYLRSPSFSISVR